MGIGGAVSVVGLLINVPLRVRPGPIDPHAIVQTTFYVLEGDKYMMILGRKFLATVYGLVDVTHHRLQYTTDASPYIQTCMPLSAACREPVFHTVAEQATTAADKTLPVRSVDTP